MNLISSLLEFVDEPIPRTVIRQFMELLRNGLEIIDQLAIPFVTIELRLAFFIPSLLHGVDNPVSAPISFALEPIMSFLSGRKMLTDVVVEPIGEGVDLWRDNPAEVLALCSVNSLDRRDMMILMIAPARGLKYHYRTANGRQVNIPPRKTCVIE